MTKKTQKRTKPAKPAAKSAKRAKAAAQVAPAKKTNPPKPPGKVYVLFGADEYARPRAARFAAEDPDLLAKAAEAMHLRLVEVTDPDVAEIAATLPAGRLHANGKGLVPYIKGDMYMELGLAVIGYGAPRPIGNPQPRTCRGPGMTLRQAMSCWPERSWNAAGGRPWWSSAPAIWSRSGTGIIPSTGPSCGTGRPSP
jgi:hypothetical protein